MKYKIITVLIWLPIILFLAFMVYVWIKYANMPFDETPNWVHWLMWGRRG